MLQPHLSVITSDADIELTRIRDVIECTAVVDGRADLEELLGRLLSVPGEHAPKTLDLIGHSSPGDCFLQLGDWVIDATSSVVTAFFRELADNEVLPRLGVHSLRLLGCSTAVTESARETLFTLADILGVRVYGTTAMLFACHYDATGFRRDREYVLACPEDLREVRDDEHVAGERFPRTLDVDALPASPRAATPWPRRLASRDRVRTLLELVRRHDGAMMPGLEAAPACEILVPSVRDDEFHRFQLVLDGAFVRVYPDGDDKPGILYPVSDRRALHAFVASLPPLH